ncbi:hypothetical protein [Ferruginibacter albus]|uniref:hypothetical protein n=1 Tax=Ferruginibacter albus TaxID=2875540 RepID=UPI001CC6B65B|nr:hypothetical protein [Ferruginibacter albus]UAY52774.1 hypothetical protein K9M53_03580 [Ferruginibacter albus]
MNQIIKQVAIYKKSVLILLLSVCLLPAATYAQTPPPPNNGQNPDNHTLAVPFDDTMNLFFLALAIGFAFILFKKMQKRKISVTTK